MGDLVVGVVVNILREVRVEHLKCGRISRISTPSRNLAVLYPPRFVVLYPEIALEYFSGGCKTKNGGVAFGEPAVILAMRRQWLRFRPSHPSSETSVCWLSS